MTPTPIVIGAGGTAGHVVPALAVADALRAEGADVIFLGGERAEAQLVPAAGYPFRPLEVRPLPRGRGQVTASAQAALTDARAMRQALAILGEVHAAAVLGAGGYVAGPTGLAAIMRRVPLVLMEADSYLGLTNRLLAPFARCVCLAFPIEGRNGDRYRLTGRPIPAPARDRERARARFEIDPDEKCVLVFGGSQGARSINRAAIDAFRGAEFKVLHAAGERNLSGLEPPGSHYDLRGYIADFGEALLASDVVVARAGGSVFEIAAHGRPAVLVPYPHATADHQMLNARFMADAGAAVVIPDSELTPARLAEEVGLLLADPARAASMSEAALAVARPRAAQEVAAAVMGAARGVRAQ